MEFPSLGVHCAFPSCSKLDFLPFTCDCCHLIFCQEHRVYEDHNCTESYIKDVKIPICPLCNQPIPVKNGMDPNVSVNQHITRDCKEQKNKLYNNRCSFSGCKKKELVQMTCSSCHRNYCIKHRLESEHDCVRNHHVAPPTNKVTSSASSSRYTNKPSSSGRKPQTSLMSQIGADLNKERQTRHMGNQSQMNTASSTTRNNGLTDDEALAIAMAASLQDGSQQSSQAGHRRPPSTAGPSSSSDKSNQQNVDEDEALARAIAASLNDRSQPKTSQQDSSRKPKPKSSEDQCIIS